MTDAHAITQGEAARLLGVSPTTIARMLERGQLTPHTNPGAGGARRVLIDDLWHAVPRNRTWDPEPETLAEKSTTTPRSLSQSQSEHTVPGPGDAPAVPGSDITTDADATSRSRVESPFVDSTVDMVDLSATPVDMADKSTTTPDPSSAPESATRILDDADHEPEDGVTPLPSALAQDTQLAQRTSPSIRMPARRHRRIAAAAAAALLLAGGGYLALALSQDSHGASRTPDPPTSPTTPTLPTGTHVLSTSVDKPAPERARGGKALVVAVRKTPIVTAPSPDPKPSSSPSPQPSTPTTQPTPDPHPASTVPGCDPIYHAEGLC